MNRREAIAALVALPEVARVSTATLQPTDVLVVECDRLLSAAGVETITTQLHAIWPNHRILVCPPGIRLKVQG